MTRVRISLHIVNTYELYDEVVTTVTDALIEAPPVESDENDDFDQWAQETIRDFTGAGHEDGKSWYDDGHPHARRSRGPRRRRVPQPRLPDGHVYIPH